MNFLQTDEVMRLMAGKKDEQEDFEDDMLSPISLTVPQQSTQASDQVQNTCNENDGDSLLYDELIDPILFNGYPGTIQEAKPKAERRDKREKKSSMTKIQEPNTLPKPRGSLSKAGGKRRRSRRRSKREGTQLTNREKWTELVQNLIGLMRATKRGRKDSDPGQRRKMRAAFTKQVTILLVPFFKKPKEAAAFLALLEARDQVSKEKETSLSEQRDLTPVRRGEVCESQEERETLSHNHSDQNSHCSDKRSVMWSMFSVDWDSTRVQRRRIARERTVWKHKQFVHNAQREIGETHPDTSTQSQQAMVQPKRNRAFELRRENERKHWRLLQDEIIGTILENIRMMTFIKKLCRPQVLAKLRQEATACGVSQSFDSFASTLPVNGDVNSWLARTDVELGNENEDEDEIIDRFLQTNQKIARSAGRDENSNNAQRFRSLLESRNDSSSFSNLSYELGELEDVIRSALEDFSPEHE